MREKSAGAGVLLFFAVFVFWCVQGGSAGASNQTGTVTAALLNVRTGPGTDFSILQYGGEEVKLESGASVTLLSASDGWYKVSFSFGGVPLEGYVSAQYVGVDAAQGTPVPDASPSAVPADPSPSASDQEAYRTVTTYKDINVPAVMLKKTAVKKKANGARLVVKKKKVSLNVKENVTIIGEKTVSGKKWFHISFTYGTTKNKVVKTGFVKNTRLKMKLEKRAAAEAVSKIRVWKTIDAAEYIKLNNEEVKLPAGTGVSIGKDKTVDGVKWMRIYFTYGGKSLNGYVRAKYVKLVKEKIVTKELVRELTEKEFEEMLVNEGFPESYKESLRGLHREYPYWQFQAFVTGIDWEDAVKGESKLGENLVSGSKSEAWKSKEEGAYDNGTGKWIVLEGKNWVAASKEAVAYYMDPRNFLNARSIFQFELLEYQPNYQTKEGTESVLSNTPFYDKSFSYRDMATGEEKKMKYSTAFVKAAKESGVSPYHLASRVKQEVVTSATTTSIAVTGTNETYPGIYNFYNIGAYSGSNPALNGLKWASEGATYFRPWTDPYRSIAGGAVYIGTGYIGRGQNTGYLQKFNVTENDTYDHQYMTNVEAAATEAAKTKLAYQDTMASTPIVFSIPVYENMPEENCPAPR